MALLTCLGLCLRQRACLHVLVFTVAERFSAEARDGKPREEALCSLLLVSWWLRTHWPMKVTWPSQDQKGGPMNTISWREKQQTIVPTFSLPGSLFSTDLCEAECCFLVAQGWSSRGWLYSRAWKRRIPTLRHPALMRMALGQSHGRHQEPSDVFSQETVNPGSNHLHSTQVFHLGGKFILCPKFSCLNILKSLLLTTEPNFSRNAAHASVREKASFQTPWPPFHHSLQASVKMYGTL